jgi:hypothetical protein
LRFAFRAKDDKEIWSPELLRLALAIAVLNGEIACRINSHLVHASTNPGTLTAAGVIANANSFPGVAHHSASHWGKYNIL